MDKSKVLSNRIGEIGEYKINIQLDQLLNNCRYFSDVVLPNTKSSSGYSQIDHIVLSPYAIFVIETKNYAGTIYGSRNRAKWSVNGKFPMNNPFNQNFGHSKAIQSILSNVEDAQIVSIVSFSRRCTFKVDAELRKIQSNELIVYDTELSEFINRKQNVLRLQSNAPIFTEDMLQSMSKVLNENNITDEAIRENHIKEIRKIVKGEELTEATTNIPKCKTCGKDVSKNVQSFCLTNEKRFKGHVYCFEHQKGK
ncbi:nuclease-related domain-containing protein [Robertmurraya andreesenii]|uniref:NERD domain-containing protein n=1 Tax=Anoxybacillus andreesenii TaxID=1325932 RepID=A0ABT9UZX3_9BACL|nr:nuclease-related domain-containing protein [Robertmurraya andreesenii]MDQ0154244.1 hypothetical protein [Robertmurraya andreesenii]